MNKKFSIALALCLAVTAYVVFVVTVIQKLTATPVYVLVEDDDLPEPDGYSTVSVQEANLTQLHTHLTQLMAWHSASQEAARLLSMAMPDCTYDGHTYSEWLSDIQKRAAILAMPAKRKALAAKPF